MNGVSASNGAKLGRIRIGLVIVLAGFLIFILGIDPSLVSQDRSPVTGFVQLAIFLFGLGFICLGGYIAMNATWNGTQKTILADIGWRVVSTGYVVTLASGMADVFGFGSQLVPRIPYFGPKLAIGVMIGEGIIAIGFILFMHLPRWHGVPET